MINSFNTKALRLPYESKVCAFNQKKEQKVTNTQCGKDHNLCKILLLPVT